MTQSKAKGKAAGPSGTGPTAEETRRGNHSTAGPDGKAELPQWLRDLIGSPPSAGSGVHSWLFKVARQLHAHRDEGTIVDLLTAATDGCGRHVPPGEIIAAVESARGCAWTPNGTARPVTSTAPPKWPEVDTKRRAIAIEGAETDVAVLWDRSPVTMGEMDAEWYIDELFPGNPLLCVGLDARHFQTASRESFSGRLRELALIVPSPMIALTGKRKSDGGDSAHCLENTGPRKYLITEFDHGTQDDQAALLWHLQVFAPLVMVVFSGSKSLHGWWSCVGADDMEIHRFFRYAASLGADPATWLRSQFVRLPGGYRGDKDRRQEVYYFNRELIGKGTIQ
jgi:hypothetical protein